MIHRESWLEFESLAAVKEIEHRVSGQNFEGQRMVQTHGKHVAAVKSAGAPIEDCDGLITNTPGLSLIVRHADCQAAIFYDPVHHAIGNVHAGWRGNVQNIYKETVLQMNKHYGSRPEDLIVCISPSLGPKHSEFKNYREEFPPSFWEFKDESDHFNLWEIARRQLANEGVKHIEIAEICTFEGNFYSFRRDKTTKRNETMVRLLPR